MLSETILTSNQQQQSEAVSAVRVIQGHMVPFDRSHTTSYSTSKATTCLSRAVLEIGRDINTANTNPANSVKIGPVNVEIVGLTVIAKNIIKK